MLFFNSTYYFKECFPLWNERLTLMKWALIIWCCTSRNRIRGVRFRCHPLAKYQSSLSILLYLWSCLSFWMKGRIYMAYLLSMKASLPLMFKQLQLANINHSIVPSIAIFMPILLSHRHRQVHLIVCLHFFHIFITLHTNVCPSNFRVPLLTFYRISIC